MIILGLDPGLALVGWGVIDYNQSTNRFRTLGYGSISTPKGLEVPERLRMIDEELDKIIEKYKPAQMAVEELFFNTNITTGIRVAEARGVLLLNGQKHGIKIFEYTPLQVKQAIVGYGRSEKKQVITMVTSFLGLKEAPKPDDTADALAIAICHAHTGCSRISQYYNLK